MRRPLLIVIALVAAAFLARVSLGGQAGKPPQTPAVAAAFSSALPVVAEHHYRMAAKIRPLLIFWIGRDNVGGARIVWRQGPERTRGWELLIGSDPARAPAHVNRWGYIREEGTPADISMLGVMKQSDEQSLDEAKARVANESKGDYRFKLIRTRVANGLSSAVVVSGGFGRDFTYRDLSTLLGAFESPSVSTGSEKRVPVGQSTKPGFLVAIADLIHDCSYTFHRSGARALTKRAVTYAYNGRLYDLTMLRPNVLANARYGDRTYARLIEASFEVQTRAGGSKEQFSIVFGVDGGLDEVPVFITYQPRWWFKAELLLDERQRF